jgi:hypothetical protein
MRRAALLVLAACGGAAKPPVSTVPLADARAKIATIELCKTTEAEVRAWLGEPVRDGRQGRLRLEDWLLADKPERVLAIVIDEHGVIVDLQWDAPGAASWTPSDHCAR